MVSLGAGSSSSAPAVLLILPPGRVLGEPRWQWETYLCLVGRDVGKNTSCSFCLVVVVSSESCCIVLCVCLCEQGQGGESRVGECMFSHRGFLLSDFGGRLNLFKGISLHPVEYRVWGLFNFLANGILMYLHLMYLYFINLM